MQSLVKTTQILVRYQKCMEKMMRISIRNRGRRYRGVRTREIRESGTRYGNRGPLSDTGLRPLVISKPPDYYNTIDAILDQINYYDNHLNLVDIGFSDHSQLMRNLSQVRKDILNQCRTESINKRDSDDITDELEHDLNYKKIYEKWLLTKEGIKSIIDLANHYSIFRDLFPPLPPPPPKSPIEDIPPKPLYYFSPIVPFEVEFCVDENKIEESVEEENERDEKGSDNVIVSRPYRGNLLLSQYCMNEPNVFIDSSAINGINNTGNYNQIDKPAQESNGQITLINDQHNYYTLALINLDSFLDQEFSTCHWLVSNIHNNNKVTHSETIIKYLPVYGIRGFGYSRYVFLLYQHNKPLSLDKVNDFDLTKRKFDAFKFMSSHGPDCKVTPIGLSWFQSRWDDNSRRVFYDYLDMRVPTYEWIPPEEKLQEQKQFPGRAPFNIYLDNYRDPKEIAKEVLLERLTKIDPYQYENMFDVSPVPPNTEFINPETPDWVKNDIMNRRNKYGKFRGLRPPSAVIPLNNNADLDKPKWPRAPSKVRPLNLPNRYPDGKRRPKPLKDTLWVKPPHEHPTYRIEHNDSLEESDRKNLRVNSDN